MELEEDKSAKEEEELNKKYFNVEKELQHELRRKGMRKKAERLQEMTREEGERHSDI